MTTLAKLREGLGLFGSAHDDKPIEVWLPGSRIALNETLMLRDNAVLIEGNVKPGSALEMLISEDDLKALAELLRDHTEFLGAKLSPDPLITEAMKREAGERLVQLVARLRGKE